MVSALELRASLAGVGADIVLNGFGEASAIRELRSGIARKFGVRVGFSEANVANAKAIVGIVEESSKGIRSCRHPGQQ